MTILIMFLLFVILLFLGLPVGFTIGLVSLFFIVGLDFPSMLLAQRMFVGLDSFPLMALPMFMLAGNLMSSGGITNRLWNFARTVVGFIPGGSGHVSVVSSMLFASMSGSALATVGGLGKLQIDGMVEDGFKRDDAAAITAAASTIGPIIPPSIVFVLYGVLAGVSVGRLFLAGVIPGILMGLSIMAYILYLAIKHREQYITRPYPTFNTFITSFIKAIPPLLSPIIILGGILGGIFTPTEAAAIVSAYSLILGIIYKEINMKVLTSIIKDTAKSSAGIMMIIGFANCFSWLLTTLGASKLFLDFVTNMGNSKVLILLFLNVALLITGCFVETNSAVILLTPLLVPAMAAAGIDPVHLGMILCVNLLIGILTPPMGMALYVVNKVSEVPFHKVARAVMPLIGCLLVVQALVTFIPEISIFLPNLIMGK